MAAVDDIHVSGGHVRGLPPSAENTSAYMTIANHSGREIVLTGARTDVAGHVMLHETVERPDGQLAMRHVMSVAISPGESLELRTGGLHLMLMDLSSPPAPGDEVELTLVFRDGLEKTVSLPVRSVLEE